MSKWGLLIQRHQDGELSEREKIIFAEKLKNDPAFVAEVELYHSVDKAITQTLQIAFIRSLGKKRINTLNDAF